jgi:hypothetical protein
MLVKAVNLEFDGQEADSIMELLSKDQNKFELPSAIHAPDWVAPIGATVFVEKYAFDNETKILKVFGDVAW